MPGEHRKHTEIVLKKQRGLFGGELSRRRSGKKSIMPSITTEELESHLHESKGKKLPVLTTDKKKTVINVMRKARRK